VTATSLATIIVGGGHSSRMQGRDKLYAPLGTRPVIAASVETFESSAAVTAIALVVAAERVAYCQELALERGWSKVHAVCAGGPSRSHSVANGLAALKSVSASCVAVHDAARPFVTAELIERVLGGAEQHGAAVPGVPCADTIRRVDGADQVCESLPREALRAMQTPQVFARELLERAYTEQAMRLADFTDDAAVVEAAGEPIAVVAGDYANMKITTPTDLAFAQWRIERSDGDV
jgi:2-C-methyl-D-erythritol 4-phosphate cytidylyltransferase